jgi:hypothetical protein
MVRLDHWRRHLTVPQFTVVTGLLVIGVGTLILALPACSAESVGLWEALFTVTSAITVTGLSIIDVGKELTLLGQIVLATLIVIGASSSQAVMSVQTGICRGVVSSAARSCAPVRLIVTSTFENGCTISVQFGPGNYTDPDVRKLPLEAPRGQFCWEANLAEVAIFLPNGEFYSIDEMDDVVGWQTVEDVCKWIDVARNIKTEVTA